MRRWVPILLVAGCTSAPDPSPVRPAGVALCYSKLADEAPATVGYWDVMHRADLAARPAALAALEAAAAEHPEEEELALLNGLGHLWRVAEAAPGEASDQNGFLKAALTARDEVQRAFALCPTDHRIPAWLGPILVNMGRAIGDQATVEMGLGVLKAGIDRYPSFVLFSKLLVFADRPAADPDFQTALGAVDANIAACGDVRTTRDPACRNGPHAPHNVEGAAVFLGDVYAKAGRRADALAAYQGGRAAPDFATWPFRALLDARIAGLDERLAAYAAGKEPDAAWRSTSQCSICHQRQPAP